MSYRGVYLLSAFFVVYLFELSLKGVRIPGLNRLSRFFDLLPILKEVRTPLAGAVRAAVAVVQKALAIEFLALRALASAALLALVLALFRGVRLFF